MINFYRFYDIDVKNNLYYNIYKNVVDNVGKKNDYKNLLDLVDKDDNNIGNDIIKNLSNEVLNVGFNYRFFTPNLNGSVKYIKEIKILGTIKMTQINVL